MATRKTHPRRGGGARNNKARHRGRRSPWALVAIVALAVAAAGGLILAGQNRAPATIAASPGGKVQGAADAPVEIDEWADFQCPACRQFALGPERQLESTYLASGQAKLVYHDLAFLGPESEQAAAAAECAAEQGQFWAYHDKLFAEQAGENRGTFSKNNLERFGAEIGLDPAAFNACVDSGRYLATVRAETAEGRRLGVRVTPTFFIDGQKLEGVPSFDALAKLVDQALAAAPQSDGSGS